MNSISGAATEGDASSAADSAPSPHTKPGQRDSHSASTAPGPDQPGHVDEAPEKPIWQQIAQRWRRLGTAPATSPAQQQQQQQQQQKEEIPPARPRHGRASPEQSGQLRLPLETAAPPAETDIPEMLRNRYLVDAQQRYYFRDRQQELAFEDLGARLRTSHDVPEVAVSMVVLARAKGWQHLKLRGSTAFKREAWLAAAERGLQVSGYRPSEVDRMRLAERLEEQQLQHQRDANEVAEGKPVAQDSMAKAAPRKRSKKAEGVQRASAQPLTARQHKAVDELEKFLRQRGDSEEAVAMTVQLAADKLAQHRTHFGKLIEHGDAPYQHDRANDMNYFATLQTSHGKQIVWGVDLQRALQESGACIGDDIVLVQQGRRPVAVSGPERDTSGRVTGKRVTVDADRNHWDVVSLDNARDFADQQARQPQPGKQNPQSGALPVPPRHASEPAHAPRYSR